MTDPELDLHLAAGVPDGPAAGGEQGDDVVGVHEADEGGGVVQQGDRRVAHDPGAVGADVVEQQGRRVVEVGGERRRQHDHRPRRHQVLQRGLGLLELALPDWPAPRRPGPGCVSARASSSDPRPVGASSASWASRSAFDCRWFTRRARSWVKARVAVAAATTATPSTARVTIEMSDGLPAPTSTATSTAAEARPSTGTAMTTSPWARRGRSCQLLRWSGRSSLLSPGGGTALLGWSILCERYRQVGACSRRRNRSCVGTGPDDPRPTVRALGPPVGVRCRAGPR